ncbi:MAG: FAD-dependent monooxygenase, partial [Thalassospira sp.]
MQDQQALHTDVIILGGGLNGAAMALALAHGGVKSVVIDYADPKT